MTEKKSFKIIIVISVILFIFLICYIFLMPRFTYTDQTNINYIYQLLKKIDCIFNKTNTQYTIIGGTLLGSIRHKGLIPWDNDADIAVLNKSFSEILDILKPLKKHNINYYLNKYNGIIKVHFLNSNTMIDIFILENNNNNYRFTPPYDLIYKNEYFTESELYPLKLYNFGPLKLYGPNIPINYLDRTYPKWNNTAVTWIFDWNNFINISSKNMDIKLAAVPNIQIPKHCNL